MNHIDNTKLQQLRDLEQQLAQTQKAIYDMMDDISSTLETACSASVLADWEFSMPRDDVQAFEMVCDQSLKLLGEFHKDINYVDSLDLQAD